MGGLGWLRSISDEDEPVPRAGEAPAFQLMTSALPIILASCPHLGKMTDNTPNMSILCLPPANTDVPFQQKLCQKGPQPMYFCNFSI